MKSTTVDKAWFVDLLNQQRISLREVARRMPIDAGALSKSLDSKRKLKPDEIRRLAEVLNRPAAEVFEHISPAATSPGQSKGFGEMPQAPMTDAEGAQPLKRHPLFGSMKGTSIVMPGVDLTQPADPDWAKVYDDDYDHGIIIEPQDTKRK
jgi:transcriptional regulator with XRE-family HTH domain